MKLKGKGVLAKPQGMAWFFGFCHQGAKLLGAKGEKMGFFAFNNGIF